MCLSFQENLLIFTLLVIRLIVITSTLCSTNWGISRFLSNQSFISFRFRIAQQLLHELFSTLFYSITISNQPFSLYKSSNMLLKLRGVKTLFIHIQTLMWFLLFSPVSLRAELEFWYCKIGLLECLLRNWSYRNWKPSYYMHIFNGTNVCKLNYNHYILNTKELHHMPLYISSTLLLCKAFCFFNCES